VALSAHPYVMLNGVMKRYVQSLSKSKHTKLSHQWWAHAHASNQPTLPVDSLHDGCSESKRY